MTINISTLDTQYNFNLCTKCHYSIARSKVIIYLYIWILISQCYTTKLPQHFFDEKNSSDNLVTHLG